jgi:hypothetical protein
LFSLGTQTLFAGSKCHDLVITDAAGTIISGHFDKKIRIWDLYVDKCRFELKFDAAITSLSYNNGKNTRTFFPENSDFNIHFRQTTITRMFKR